jgi:hypothetical protein
MSADITVLLVAKREARRAALVRFKLPEQVAICVFRTAHFSTNFFSLIVLPMSSTPTALQVAVTEDSEQEHAASRAT